MSSIEAGERSPTVRLINVFVRNGECVARLVIDQKQVDALVPRKILGSLIAGLGQAASTLLVLDDRG